MSTLVKLCNGRGIPRVAFGTGTKWFQGVNHNNVDDINNSLVEAIKTALALGFTHIDTAEVHIMLLILSFS
jgi:diketogulonate reductase-like aldo/keto reductase